MWNQEINHNGRPPLVEDEPSHEIYANLTGLKNASRFRPRQQQNKQEQHQDHTYQQDDRAVYNNLHSSRTMIPVEKSDQNELSGSAPISIYRKRLAEGCTISKLSIDQTNKGFQMLKRMGWKESEGGLGKKRQGKLTPVKTILKRDKRGLGSRKAPSAKVTHTTTRTTTNASASATDGGHGRNTNGRYEEPRQETKAQRRHRVIMEAEKDKWRDKRARLLIASDLPEELLAYL